MLVPQLCGYDKMSHHNRGRRDRGGCGPCDIPECTDREVNHFVPQGCHTDFCTSYSHDESCGPDLDGLCGLGPKRTVRKEVRVCGEEDCRSVVECERKDDCCSGSYCGKCSEESWCQSSDCCGYKSSHCGCFSKKSLGYYGKYIKDKKQDKLCGYRLQVTLGAAQGSALQRYASGYVFHINGRAAPVLHLKRGETYFFDLHNLSRDGTDYYFMLTDHPAGSANAHLIAGGMNTGCLCYKVEKDAPKYMYYQARGNMYMGGLIIVHDK